MPFGDRRRSRLASRTSSGLISTHDLRPSHLPAAARLRSRALVWAPTRRHVLHDNQNDRAQFNLKPVLQEEAHAWNCLWTMT
jgi:hypothetical protein